MRARSLSHLSDAALLRCVSDLLARDHETTAELLLHLAEVDERRLFVPSGYPSMHAFCVGEWHLAEDVAFKRIQAARAARDFPIILDAVAEGRLHLTAVVLLAPHLTPENAAELLKAAAFKTKAEIQELLAQRYPRSESLPLVMQVVPGRMATRSDGDVRVQGMSSQQDPDPVAVPRPKVEPIAPERFSLSITMGRSMRDKLQHAQELMCHQGADVVTVLERALDALIVKLEKRTFAATDMPRATRRQATANRTIPAAVRRAVWERDGGQCTFVSETGHRCLARARIEFDHIEPVARGGQSTVENLRLRCRVAPGVAARGSH